jgi:diguanylate cyclase (GGDEF)-like protein
MLFRKKKEPSKETCSASAAEAGELARDTVAAVLRTLAKFALPTNQVPLDRFAARTEALAKAVLILSEVDEKRKRPVKFQKIFAEIKQLVREQRQAESSEYAAHRESAHIIVSDLVTSLKRSLEQRQGYDKEIVDLLTEMEEVVEKGDLEAIKRVAAKTAKQIKNVISVQRDQDRAQLEKLSDQLRVMREELSEARSQMQRDPLTELLNRGAFDDALERTVSLSHASAAELTLFMLDLDHFKTVNDRLGHQAGDQVLKTVSKQLIRCFPRRDDIVVRYGGEEFAVLCRNTGMEEAPMLAERVRSAVERMEIDLEEHVHRQTISVGVAVLENRESAARFLKRADDALYQAKRSGRNRVEITS